MTPHSIASGFYTLTDLSALFHEHRTTTWRKVKARIYPPPIYIVPGKPLFLRAEIDALVQRAKSQRDRAS